MTRFTDSPYEKIMTQIPMGKRAADFSPPPFPPGHPCYGCPYGKGAPCIGVCLRKLVRRR